MMFVKVTVGDAWYKDFVGKTFMVEPFTVWFRETGGGERVPHYALKTKGNQQLIDCRHAVVINK